MLYEKAIHSWLHCFKLIEGGLTQSKIVSTGWKNKCLTTTSVHFVQTPSVNVRAGLARQGSDMNNFVASTRSNS